MCVVCGVCICGCAPAEVKIAGLTTAQKNVPSSVGYNSSSTPIASDLCEARKTSFSTYKHAHTALHAQVVFFTEVYAWVAVYFFLIIHRKK